MLSAASLALAALAAVPALAQAPNTVASSFPKDRTESYNGSYFFVPVADEKLEELTKPYKLVPLPTSDKSLFPNGYPAGTHPVLVYAGYGNDIRQTIAGVPAYIPNLLSAQVNIPYVDRLGDGKTPFSRTVAGYIAGPDNVAEGVVPALVGSLFGFGYQNLYVATEDPSNAAYSSLSNDDHAVSVKDVVVPYTVSGPGVYPSALDILFTDTKDAEVSHEAIMEALNHPAILGNGKCQYNAMWFNETFADPVDRAGNVTLYSPALPTQLTDTTVPNGGKVFTGAGVGGFTGTCELVGMPIADCATAAQQYAAAKSGY